MTLDPYFTPAYVADAMVWTLQRSDVKQVADFSAGAGELLAAASGRWPRARMLANDVDDSIVRHLRRTHPSWITSNSDFLNPTSRRSSRHLREIEGKTSVALLNPPFSGRGNAYLEVEIGRERIKCSRALAFVLTATSYLARHGELVAVVPKGSLTSLRDREAFAYLRAVGTVDVVGNGGRNVFAKCFPSISLLRVRKGQRRPSNLELRACELPAGPLKRAVSIVRGCRPLYTLEGHQRGLPFIHSTGLMSGRVSKMTRIPRRGQRVLDSPGVLFPRVGKPIRDKLCLHEGEAVVLSDCVYGIVCGSKADARRLLALLRDRWTEMASLYSGTGAPHLATGTLIAFLEGAGVCVNGTRHEG